MAESRPATVNGRWPSACGGTARSRRRWPSLTLVRGFLAVALSVASTTSIAGTAHAQSERIDTVIVTVGKPFPAERASGVLPRTMNALHITTRARIVRRELLLDTGDLYDAALVAETERILRGMQIFKEVRADSVRLDDGRLALRVDTRDSWTTSPAIGLGVGAGGTVTYKFGLTELNVLGTGALAYGSYRKDVDRTAFEAAAKGNNLFGSAVRAKGYAQFLSDGFVARWDVGDPFRAMTDPRAIAVAGEYASQRILQFRATPTALDTTIYDRDAFLSSGTVAFAVSSTPDHVLRVGGHARLRQERFVLRGTDSVAVPDSISGALGLFVSWQRARFISMRRFNGLGDEDIEAGLYASVGVVVAPRTFGYARTGVGPEVTLRGTLPFRRGFATLHVQGHGIFDASGLDSGAVEVRLTTGVKPAERHATILHVQAGAMEGQTPGAEYDLGFNVPPRSWAPHAFVGTRSVWGALEHKWYVVDALFGLFGGAVAAFADYGGAWFQGEDPRFGGDVGIGLRIGSALSGVARTGRIDLGWRFGGGVPDNEGLVLSIGMGWVYGGGRDPTCEPAVYHVGYRCRPREN